ncbi:uncharacterized protein BYT42DRAFT_332899 [Radiomyces spectabilis]|uniref:uncharacterized protein n=1 Tax=Radiomyces spectabilis TaxID=64574 RepID=UPI00221E6FFD|nr:uncharacterized protein BYT42DRAFT_332899 [Radiomyces spectabilis]KAI8379599.1 hypothetical protein BYT42DRAFT_332899 [Radiomyces spectabilis]
MLVDTSRRKKLLNQINGDLQEDLYLTTGIRLPHGCRSNGALARAVVVEIPNAVTRLQVQWIPGWNSTVNYRQLNPPREENGKQVTQAPSSVRWEGGPLPAGHFLDFNMRIRIPDIEKDRDTLYFPTSVECDGARDLWNQIPDTPGYDKDSEFHAPLIHVGSAVNKIDTPWVESKTHKEMASAGTTLFDKRSVAAGLAVSAAAAVFHLA